MPPLKILQSLKARLLTTSLTAAGTVGLSGYLGFLSQQQGTQNAEATALAILTGIFAASVPKLLDVIIGVASNIISGDLHEKLKAQELYKQIPPEANLYQASFVAFQSVLNNVINRERSKADKKQVENLRDIKFETWLELVSLDEKDDNVPAVAREVLGKFKDEKIIENQFLQNKKETPTDFLTRQDWLILLLRLQNKEENYLVTDLENKVLDALEESYTERLNAVFSEHAPTFQKITLQLWEHLFGKLEDIHDDVRENKEISQDTNQELKDFRQEFRASVLTQPVIKDHPTQKYFPSPFPQPTRFFTGREDILEEISNVLDTTKRACLHDISGIGKTSVVLRYANISAEKYDYIFYLKPNDINFLDVIWHSAKELGLTLPLEAKSDEKLAEFGRWLGTHQNWLVVFDNVTDVQAIFKFTKDLKNGHFLFTSNDHLAHHLGNRVGIAKFNDEDSRLLLYRRGIANETADFSSATDEEKQAIDNIVREFDGLPLALNICGAFIAENMISFARFSHDVSEYEAAFGDYSFTIDGAEYKSFGKVFEMTFKKLVDRENKTEEASDIAAAVEILFKTVSLLAPNAIPENILSETLKRIPERYAIFAENDTAWLKFRKHLFKYDLLQFKFDTETLETHRLIQKAVEKQFLDGDKEFLVEIIANVLNSLSPSEVHKIWDGWGKYIPHGQHLLETAEKLSIENNTIGLLCNQIGLFLKAIGQYKLAESMYKKALVIRKKELGENHPDTATGYNNLALLYNSQGKYELAEPLYKKALAIWEKELGENHPDTATSYNNLAGLYFERENHGLAREYQQKSLKALQANFGEDHPDVALSYWWLGTFLEKEEKYKESLDNFYKAREIYLRFLPKDHPHVQSLQAFIDRCESLIREN